MTPIVAEHPLKKWRQCEGLTLDAAARRVGTSRSVWWQWENRRRTPSAVYMPKLRELTGGAITADTFYPPKDEAA